jgi:hypothetical protein
LQQLWKAIGEPPVLAVHYDACKGLTATVLDVLPHAERKECFRHLMQNYIKKFVGKEFMYPATHAYRGEVYAHHMTNVAFIPGVIPWMKEYHKLTCYMSGFNQAIKCDYITNNIVEVFNNWIKDYKDLPVCELVDKIRVMWNSFLGGDVSERSSMQRYFHLSQTC